MREGLMDDTGYHGPDDAEAFWEHWCSECYHGRTGECEFFCCNGERYTEETSDE